MITFTKRRIIKIEIEKIITWLLPLIATVSSLYAAHKSNKSAEKNNEVTNRTNKEISGMEQESENKRNNIQIDANIVWKARVEWIQKVRNLTAKFVSAANNYISSDNNKLSKKNFEMMWEKSRLLILYFGPDSAADKDINIMNKYSNKSKNEKIVQLIKEICDIAEDYSLHLKSMKEYEHGVSKCKTHRKYALASKKKYIRQYKDKINILIESMRIYLKIEWNRTKERKGN